MAATAPCGNRRLAALLACTTCGALLMAPAHALLVLPKTMAGSKVQRRRPGTLRSQTDDRAEGPSGLPSMPDGGDNQPNILDGVGNLFHQLLSSAPTGIMPSMPDVAALTSSLPGAMSDAMASVSNLHDVWTSHASPDGRERYEEVYDFDEALAREVEEALRLAEVASDIEPTVEGSAVAVQDHASGREGQFSVWREGNDTFDGRGETATDGSGVNSSNHHREYVREGHEERQQSSSLFRENNAAELAGRPGHAAFVARENDSEGKNRGMDDMNGVEVAPSMFREINNAAAMPAPSNTAARGNGVGVGESYANVPDVKHVAVGKGRLAGRGVSVQSSSPRPKAWEGASRATRTETAVPFYASSSAHPPFPTSNSAMERRTVVSPEHVIDDDARAPPPGNRGSGAFDGGGARNDSSFSEATAATQRRAAQRARATTTAREAYGRYQAYLEGGIDSNSSGGPRGDNRARHDPAREAHVRPKESFDRGIGGNVPSSKGARRDKAPSRKIYITDAALSLAQSLQLDLGELSRHTRREGGLDNGGRTTIEERDVREYLDRRYEELFSMLPAGGAAQSKDPSRSNRSRRVSASAKNGVGERVGDGYGPRNRSKMNAEDDWEALRDNPDLDEDAFGWTESQFSRRRAMPRHQRSQRNQSRQGRRDPYGQRHRDISPSTRGTASDRHDASTHPPTDDGAEMQGHRHPPSAMPPVASVPLSHLISTPRLERLERADLTPEAFDLSDFRPVSQAEFRQTYRQSQRQDAMRHDPSQYSQSLVGKNGSATMSVSAGSEYQEPFRERLDHRLPSQWPVQQVTDARIFGPNEPHNTDEEMDSEVDISGPNGWTYDDYAAYFATNTQIGRGRRNDGNLSA